MIYNFFESSQINADNISEKFSLFALKIFGTIFDKIRLFS